MAGSLPCRRRKFQPGGNDLSNISTDLKRFLGTGSELTTREGLPVASPSSVEETALILGRSRERGWRVSLAGHGTWEPADPTVDLIVSTSRMNTIRSVDPADLVVSVDAGVRLAELEPALSDEGVWVAMDPPGTGRSIGSILATDTPGPLAHAFGSARENLLGITLVTLSGKIVTVGGTLVKNVAGFDLTRLAAGSFGAMGLICKAHLRLRAKPTAEVSLLRVGPLEELRDLGVEMAQSDLSLVSLELLSPEVLGRPEWTLGARLMGSREFVDRATARFDGLTAGFRNLTQGESRRFWLRVAESHSGSVSIRLGHKRTEIQSALKMVLDTLPPGAVSLGVASGRLRWCGDTDRETIRRAMDLATAADHAFTVERAPRDVTAATGRFPVASVSLERLYHRLLHTFDPSEVGNSGILPA